MKLQKMQQEVVAHQPDQLNSGGGALEGVLEKPACRINKEAKPMLQILDSNTSTSNKLQVAASTGRANAPVTEDEGGNKRSSSFDGWSEAEEESRRERLKRHRVEVAREVWILDVWGQEDFLMNWIDFSDFDSALASRG